MRHLHYVEIRNFKAFGARIRIELDHPAVLVGPNNCGKTTKLQTIALWSQAVQTWFDRKGEAPPRERTAIGLNRLAIVAVPRPMRCSTSSSGRECSMDERTTSAPESGSTPTPPACCGRREPKGSSSATSQRSSFAASRRS